MARHPQLVSAAHLEPWAPQQWKHGKPIDTWGGGGGGGNERLPPLRENRLAGLVVKGSVSRAADHGFESRFVRRGILSGSSHTSDLKIRTPLATLPGVIGSALGLVGPMSMHCDWMDGQHDLQVVFQSGST